VKKIFSVLALGLSFGLPGVVYSEAHFFIDDYKFSWMISEEKNGFVSIEKTQDTLFVQLVSGDGMSREYMRLSPQMAEKVGQALSQAPKYYKKMKDVEEDTTERLMIGDTSVTYSKNMKYGFSVWVKEKGGWGMLSFDYKTAAKLGRELVSIKEKAEFLEATLDF
jgi:hypothetical protein